MKVYIVEDNPFYAELLATDLSNLGIETVEIFYSAEDCSANLNSSVDLVIADYHLDKVNDGMNGLDFFRYTREKHPGIPFVMLTGQDDVQLAVNMMKEGIYDYIIKDDQSFAVLRKIIINLRQELRIKEKVQKNSSKIVKNKKGFIRYIAMLFGLIALLIASIIW